MNGIRPGRERMMWASRALMAAMLPSLLWLGHWSVRVPLPGTDPVVAIGMSAEHDAQRAEAGGHGEHCHGDASCSDAPAAPIGIGFGLMSQALALLGAGGLLTLAVRLAWRPGADAPVRPLLQPPRVG